MTGKNGRKKPCLTCNHLSSDHTSRKKGKGKCEEIGCDCKEYRPSVQMAKT